MRVSRYLLLSLCFYNVFAMTLAMAEDKQNSAVDLEFIEQLGSMEADQESLQAAMEAYYKNKPKLPAPTSTEQKLNVTAPIPSSKKAGTQP